MGPRERSVLVVEGEVPGRVEDDDPAVGLLLALDVGGTGLDVDLRPEPDPRGRPTDDHGPQHMLELRVGAGRNRGGGDLRGPVGHTGQVTSAAIGPDNTRSVGSGTRPTANSAPYSPVTPGT